MQTNTTNLKSEQLTTMIELIGIAYQLMAACGSAGKPSGHLYAEMMSAFATLDAYQSMVDVMLRCNIVRDGGNHLLIAQRLDLV